MELNEIVKEKILVDIISERDQIIINLCNEIKRLQEEIDKLRIVVESNKDS